MAIFRRQPFPIVPTFLGIVFAFSTIADVSTPLVYAYEDDDPDGGWLQRSMTSRGTQPGHAETSSRVHPVSTYPRDESVFGSSLPGESLPEPRERKEEMKSSKWENLAPSKIVHNVKTMIYGGPNESVARALFAEGEQLFAEKSYHKAADRYQNTIMRWPNSTLEEDAMFKVAESQFFADDYPDAFKSYEKLLKKYAYSKHLDLAVYRVYSIGDYWNKLQAADPQPLLSFNVTNASRPWTDTLGHALKCFDAVRMYDPTGKLADEALMSSAAIYYHQKRYEEAAYHYSLIRKEYPDSKYLIKAHLLELESHQEMYQGPGYDGKPLDTAAEVSDILLTQFQSKLGDKHQAVIEAKNRIVRQQAERDWEIAQYFERRKYFGAARFYYQAIVEDYPHTPIAEASRKRFAEIRNYPSEPPKRLKWLTDVISPEDE